jgi:hypothetical protein
LVKKRERVRGKDGIWMVPTQSEIKGLITVRVRMEAERSLWLEEFWNKNILFQNWGACIDNDIWHKSGQWQEEKADEDGRWWI